MTSAVTSVLGRLPSVQLYVLNAVVQHWQEWVRVDSSLTCFSMMHSTKSEEPDDIYVTKLALSLGRSERMGCILEDIC